MSLKPKTRSCLFKKVKSWCWKGKISSIDRGWIKLTKRILFCATVDYHFKAFHLPYMKWLREQGWKVDVAAAGEMSLPYTNNKYNIPIKRSPLHRSNITAFKQLKRVIDKNNYTIIHCHTPLGGVLSRLAARHARKQGTKVIYTAHGFHFCKGAPIFHWLIYYPIEKYLSRYTDSLITINLEDYELAKKRRFKAKNIKRISGVGVDINKFRPVDENKKIELRKSFGYEANDFLLFNAAEFNKNKNQQLLLHSLALLKEGAPHVKLLLAGEGPLLEECRELTNRLEISHMVNFIGFRKDLDEIIPMCDLSVAPSFREGLPVNVMESMACGLPVLATDNRGHRELVHNNKNGWVLPTGDPQQFSQKINKLTNEPTLQNKLGKYGRELMIQKYSTKIVLEQQIHMYKAYMDDEQGETIWAIH